MTSSIEGQYERSEVFEDLSAARAGIGNRLLGKGWQRFCGDVVLLVLTHGCPRFLMSFVI
jgi:hypothetical protein